MTSSKEHPGRYRSWYLVYFETGFVLSLMVLIIAFHVDWSPTQELRVNLQEQEIVEMEEIQQTEQETEPPPPPKPPAPVEAPNNAVIEQEDIDFDASLDLDQQLNVSEKPPSPDDTEEQEENSDEPEIFVAVEQSPDCGGISSLQEEIQYPPFAKKAGIEGRVIVQFVVDEKGNITNPTVTHGAHTLLEEEAVRAVQELECTPGRQRDEPVKVRMSMPVSFRLEGGPR